jgi:UDP-N-acetylmuramate dehydrogenase
MVTSALVRELRGIEGVRLWAGAPVAPFTTIATGGKVDLLVTVSSPRALHSVLSILDRGGIPWSCLGAGSNLLVADQGYRGALVKLGDDFHYLEGLPPRGLNHEPGVQVKLVVGGGSSLARLSAVVAECGLSGLEFACGIPGSVGGGIRMNAGAHGQSMANVVEAVQIVSPQGVAWVLDRDLEWGYRHCSLPQDAVAAAVRLRLTGGDGQEILQNQRSLLRSRRQSQPRGVRTFGSVFKNPAGYAAGRLLEEAGLKGMRHGGAEVSVVHANFIVNTGDATTSDVLALMMLMRQAVERMHGIRLEPEVKLLGSVFPWAAEPAEEEQALVHDG